MIDISKADLTKVYDISKQIVDIYKRKLKAYKIDASGTLSQTADFDVDYDDNTMTIYFVLESYWYYVEKGRNASTGKWGSWNTKQKDIENWLQNKIARGYFVPRPGHTIPRTPKEIRSVSYVIARKITNVGYYGRTHYGLHPLQDTLDEADSLGLISDIVSQVYAAFSSAVDVEFEKI